MESGNRPSLGHVGAALVVAVVVLTSGCTSSGSQGLSTGVTTHGGTSAPPCTATVADRAVTVDETSRSVLISVDGSEGPTTVPRLNPAGKAVYVSESGATDTFMIFVGPATTDLVTATLNGEAHSAVPEQCGDLSFTAIRLASASGTVGVVATAGGVAVPGPDAIMLRPNESGVSAST